MEREDAGPPGIIAIDCTFDYRVVLGRALGREATYRSGSTSTGLGGIAASLDVDHLPFGPHPTVRIGQGILVLEEREPEREGWWKRIWNKRRAVGQRVAFDVGGDFESFLSDGDVLRLQRTIRGEDYAIALERDGRVILWMHAPAPGWEASDARRTGGAMQRAFESGRPVLDGDHEYRVVRVEHAVREGVLERSVLCKVLVGSGAERLVGECAGGLARGTVDEPYRD